MTYKTILVHLQLGHPHAALLHLAGSLASRYGAALIGVAASEPMQVLVADGGAEAVLISEDAQRALGLCERAFHLALGEQVPSVQWCSRSDCVSASRFVADAARRSDLILTDAAPTIFFG